MFFPWPLYLGQSPAWCHSCMSGQNEKFHCHCPHPHVLNEPSRRPVSDLLGGQVRKPGPPPKQTTATLATTLRRSEAPQHPQRHRVAPGNGPAGLYCPHFLALETMLSSVLTRRKVSKSQNQGGAPNHAWTRAQTKESIHFIPMHFPLHRVGPQIWAKQLISCPPEWGSPPDLRMAHSCPVMRGPHQAFLLSQVSVNCNSPSSHLHSFLSPVTPVC